MMSTRKFTPWYAVTSSILVRSMGDHSYQKSTKNTRIIILGSFVVDFEQKMGKKLKTDCTPLVLTLALSRSTAFMSDPWKYLILVCCLFSRPSSSRSGSALRSTHNQRQRPRRIKNSFSLTVNSSSFYCRYKYGKHSIKKIFANVKPEWCLVKNQAQWFFVNFQKGKRKTGCFLRLP